MRSSPESPTSPKIVVVGGIGFLRKDEAIAVSTARSVAGSVSFIPPTTFMKTSWFWRLSFPCFSRTAIRIWSLFKSNPFAVLLGYPNGEVETSA